MMIYIVLLTLALWYNEKLCKNTQVKCILIFTGNRDFVTSNSLTFCGYPGKSKNLFQSSDNDPLKRWHFVYVMASDFIIIHFFVRIDDAIDR